MKHFLFFMLTFCGPFSITANSQETLLVFNGMHPEKLDDIDGMNVAHQVLTGLIDQAAPMLVSIDVWNHILQRRDRFRSAVLNKKSVSWKVQQLVDEVDQKIKQNKSIQALNKYFNNSWYAQNYSDLAGLSEDQKKSVMFDYFCTHVEAVAAGWDGYLTSTGYLLLLPPSYTVSSFHLAGCKKLTSKQLFSFTSLYKIDLVDTLKTLLTSSNISWIFYLTGHGIHADQKSKESKIAGLSISTFQSFLHFLQSTIKTKLLVYSSCFSSGMHLVQPYQSRDGSSLLLDFPVIATCLTDAPVYVFGTASGLKLPPYDGSFCLEASDIANGQLQWYLMQKFNDFVKYGKRKNKFKQIAQSVMLYQECNQKVCNITKLENIALMRMAKDIFFIPVDTKYVDCIIHNSNDERTVDGKHGLLWYIKQYQGTINLKGKVPQFLSIIPGNGAIWMNKLQVSGFSLSSFIQQAFFSVEDIHHTQIFLCETLVLNDESTFHKVMIIPSSGWLLNGIFVGSGGWCCYLQGGSCFGLQIADSGSSSEPYLLNDLQKVKIKKMWNLLRQDSKIQEKLAADQLWSVTNFNERQKKYKQLLTECQRKTICK